MVSKNQWRAIAIVLAVVLLLAAFMTGLTGIADGISPVGEVRDDYASFKKELDALSDNEKALADGKRSSTRAGPRTTRARPLTISCRLP